MAKRKNNILSVLAIVAVGLGLASLLFFPDRPLAVEEYDVRFEIIEEGGGFDVNTTALTFGNLNPGGAAVRKIIARNEYDFPVIVKIMISRNLDGILISEPEYVLVAGEEKEISFTLYPPEDMSPGKYEGSVRVEIYKS